jgi:hypothetical protein
MGTLKVTDLTMLVIMVFAADGALAFTIFVSLTWPLTDSVAGSQVASVVLGVVFGGSSLRLNMCERVVSRAGGVGPGLPGVFP